ncbi:TetM/TetW/TetO/TetS family tetracycline resistance ribosomal protection protein [Limosilactobacillus sp. STM2_1]|uniref:TetM/TetW/TetO/TetS family tetracycline resistance ribosomal protection protein n=1 Tax=Limosilactobacillus rudii TaxID=2759755 RepID=A0A7W3UL18_9LACO|nr:TetM/TetW/TetO/TetS family tetracycline resistance ribosomal protection protein [Limosilactobacillus rudii]MBB1079481.1 TetM/TetW/TetO/TetS family tetracycline resistance ribosomal protection protein [Limosilactobacillus rudii]MBB1097527.1 TetM/TetW/TetO/TetS family tetracycline resistance ribosomal protection protein [Limosilactobacillus rudii]MCD7134637.1 TetM/TetW/TetO/TetS family tetracycline resistance ribosomal protection protein [Limosilactobacillus rudii]
MKHIVTGIIAHVDAGKTTLTEALMYQTGNLRKLGRVDNGDSFLDPNTLEKQRGITIFTHQAELTYNSLALTLLDTPGHVDFASQTEQVLPVLDYAILVISATDGIQGYTRTLWQLLKRYNVPTFIFINKGDIIGANPQMVIKQLQDEFSAGCIEFTDNLPAETIENIAMQDDSVLEKYLNTGTIDEPTIRSLIKQRKVFPCFIGAALKLTGVDNLLTGLEKWTTTPSFSPQFGARVFKISHDKKGNRLSWLRVTGGSLPAKAEVADQEKVNQIRVYNGAKFTTIQALTAGQVGAVTGLISTYPGQGLGINKALPSPLIRPVLSYAVKVADTDLHACLSALKKLEDEDPQLQVSWHPHIQEIHVQIMGEVQLQILQQLLKERYGIQVSFDEGTILYQETITSSVEGVGHFEPLRHYAEVHLLLEPGKPGSGITLASDCSLDILDRNWQHQILTSIQSKEHRGVLTGAPLTDIKITLIGGRGHIKHTEGGDFRQASWRAIRQGLMELKQKNGCLLLEPWYSFHLTIPNNQVGRAINDIQQMHGTFKLEESDNSLMTTIIGKAPVALMIDYAKDVREYSHGQGQLDLVFNGYQPCHNAQEVISNANYDPVADLPNTPNSVFCAHGAGFPVSWDKVPTMAHFPYRK